MLNQLTAGNETKGCGFIEPDQRGKDVFVQRRRAIRHARAHGGMKISYEVESERKSGKESATNLKAA